jgi:outer membrane protein OmpA-like peptidoglycan-associated protein
MIKYTQIVKFPLHAFVLAVGLSVSSSGFALSLTGAAQAGLFTPSTKTRSHYEQLTQRIQPLLKHEDVLVRYQAAKAHTWLSYAQHETYEGSLSLAQQQAYAEAERLVIALEQGQPISLTTPIPSTSGVMRRDLWAIAEIIKQYPAFQSDLAMQVAQAEVKLVWAAAEHCELGWRHSREHFALAERLLYSARATAQLAPDAPAWPENIRYPSLVELNGVVAGCHGVVGPWPLLASLKPDVRVEPSEPPIEPPAVLPAELLELPNNVHFALDKSLLSVDSKLVLDQIAIVLRAHPEVTVTLYGYTDARASDRYNQALSARRARAVEQYLVSQGVGIERIAREAKGESNILTDADDIRGHALSRRVELVFASDAKELKAVPQTNDLQLERQQK